MKKYHYLILFLFASINIFSQTNEKKYFFVFLNTNPDRKELTEDKVMELQQGHMNNINKLFKEGKLITAGPVKGGGGIFVLHADSLDEAMKYLQSDPAIEAGRFKLEVLPMDIIKGKLCVVSEGNFSMVNYSFLRYEGQFISDNELLLAQIEFKDENGGVAVINYDLENGSEDELNGFYTAEKIIYTKTLWIGKGSFCE